MTFVIRRNQVDSEVFGCNVLDISGAVEADDAVAVTDQCAALIPYYATLTLPMEDLRTIHAFQKGGFEYIETKLRLTARICRAHDLSRYAHVMSEVSSLGDLTEVLSIAESTFTDDRIRNDPALGGDAGRIASLRYRRYVEKSFHAADEVVLKLTDCEINQIVAFSTFRVANPHEIVLLLGGVDHNCKGTGLGAINNWFAWNEYIRRGYRSLTTHVSARNTAIQNLHVGREGFKVDSAWVVLRKLNRGTTGE